MGMVHVDFPGLPPDVGSNSRAKLSFERLDRPAGTDDKPLRIAMPGLGILSRQWQQRT